MNNKDKQRNKTTEKHLLDIILAILLMFGTGICIKSTIGWHNELQKRPNIRDLHQQQEMIDYHKAQGRKIEIFESINYIKTIAL